MMWTGWGIHWGWMVGFWAIVFGLIAWAVVRVAPTTPDRDQAGARSILDQRYARGELDDEEYRRRRGELRG